MRVVGAQDRVAALGPIISPLAAEDLSEGPDSALQHCGHFRILTLYLAPEIHSLRCQAPQALAVGGVCSLCQVSSLCSASLHQFLKLALRPVPDLQIGGSRHVLGAGEVSDGGGSEITVQLVQIGGVFLNIVGYRCLRLSQWRPACRALFPDCLPRPGARSGNPRPFWT